MAINVEEIKRFFEDNRTPEQKACDDEIAAEWAAYDAEQSTWNDKCYRDEVDPAVFRQGREEIRQKYLIRGVVQPASF